MMGIPYRLVRQADEKGTIDKVLYLSTRRSGQDGQVMTDAKREFRKQRREIAKVFSRFEALDRKLKSLPPMDPDYDKTMDARERALDKYAKAEEAAQVAAEKIVKASLRLNYGDKANEMMDQLTNADVINMVDTLEMGEQPEVFFRSDDPRSKRKATSPQGDGSVGSSSSTDGAEKTSPVERSD